MTNQRYSPEFKDEAVRQIVEGHNRLGYLLAMYRVGMLEKMEHEVYLLSKRQ